VDDGVWTLHLGLGVFVWVDRKATVGPAPVPPIDVAMSLVPAGDDLSAPVPPTVQPRGRPVAPPSTPPDDAAPAAGATDGLIVNGSTYNAAASPFAQPPAFGNYRPRARSLFSGSVALSGGTSAWDARPYSFLGQAAPPPDYADVQFAGTFGGPVKVPLFRGHRPQLTASYQHSLTTSANAVRARVPTALERAGDFSASVDRSGGALSIVDPRTGAPFPGDRIPVDRISPQALALLAYYPLPNTTDGAAAALESSVTDETSRDAVQVRLATALTSRHQVIGTLAYDRARTESTSLFLFTDRHRTSDLDAGLQWLYRWSQVGSMRVRYEFVQGVTRTRPFFAGRVDVSGAAGIVGGDSSPESWGPPTLAFASGLAGLTSAAPASQRARTHLAAADLTWLHGHHDVTFGGEWRPRRVTLTSLANPRGTFTFTGGATGDDFADFLLGLPHASSIGFGDGRALLGVSAAAYATDDWHPAAALTIAAGVRWEYESPFREQEGRLANLDLAPDFSAAAPVTPALTTGPITGARYPATLIEPDRTSIEPRLGVSWRPFAAS
jgi:hypothetical protein